MKKIILYIIGVCFISIGCNNEVTKEPKNNLPQNNGFLLSGTISNLTSNKTYLNKIIENSIYVLDSSSIEDNTFEFAGIVDYPERYALTFKDYATIVVLILENKTMHIELDGHNLKEPIITGSELNSKLNEYKIASKNIFSKIDYLFPHFQKARLENDAEKLDEIGSEMKKIEAEFTNYSYDFIEKNKNSYIAAMILNDRLKTSYIDTLRITKSYLNLSDEVKKCPDAQIIAETLNLH